MLKQQSKKSLFLFAGITLALAKSSQNFCFPQVSSPAGCIQSCKLPKYADCKDKFFIQIYNPQFCGYNQKDNAWINYTFACQACNNPDVIGLIHSKCNCSFTGCKENQTCNISSGQCQVVQTPKCSSNIPNEINCGRLSNKADCPELQYIRAPDLNFCGIDNKGVRQGFARACQVCLSRKYHSYYEAPCDQIPQKLCQDYQFCTIQGKCLDKCAAIKCSPGYQCKKGQCRKIRNGPCSNDSNCYFDQFCQNKNCVNKCAGILCIQGKICSNGQCIPIKSPIPKIYH